MTTFTITITNTDTDGGSRVTDMLIGSLKPLGIRLPHAHPAGVFTLPVMDIDTGIVRDTLEDLRVQGLEWTERES